MINANSSFSLKICIAVKTSIENKNIVCLYTYCIQCFFKKCILNRYIKKNTYIFYY